MTQHFRKIEKLLLEGSVTKCEYQACIIRRKRMLFCKILLICSFFLFINGIRLGLIPGTRLISPNITHLLLPNSSWTNVDIPMQYLINNDVCSTIVSRVQQKIEPKVLIVTLIKTGVGNQTSRNVIRQSIPKEVLRKLGVRRIFLLGRPNSPNNSDSPSESSNYTTHMFQQLVLENEEHQDMLVGDFLDTYRNLTYKTLMGLDWATKFCPQAKFILNYDDDMVVDFYQLTDVLSKVLMKKPTMLDYKIVQTSSKEESEWGYRKKDPINQLITSLRQKLDPQSKDRRFIVGPSMGRLVLRKKGSKWFVSKKEYPHKYYPYYATGIGFVTTVETARDLVSISKTVPFFWIDDVHVTGFLREKGGIDFVSITNLTTLFSNDTECCLPSRFADLHPLDLKIDPTGQEGETMDRQKDLQRPKWCHFLMGKVSQDLNIHTKLQAHAKFCHESKLCERVGSLKEQLGEKFCKKSL